MGIVEQLHCSSIEIIALLAEKKIAVSHKILLKDIALLNEYGYEVLTYKKKYHYYYVVNRHFDSAEIAFLADAVQASKLSATQKQTPTNKLMTTMGGLSSNGIDDCRSLRNNAQTE